MNDLLETKEYYAFELLTEGSAAIEVDTNINQISKRLIFCLQIPNITGLNIGMVQAKNIKEAIEETRKNHYTEKTWKEQD